MSSPFSAEHLARIRDDARRLVVRAGDQEDYLEGLVRAADADVRDAETALSVALDGADVDAGKLQRLSSAQLRRAVERAAEAERRPASVRASSRSPRDACSFDSMLTRATKSGPALAAARRGARRRRCGGRPRDGRARSCATPGSS